MWGQSAYVARQSLNQQNLNIVDTAALDLFIVGGQSNAIGQAYTKSSNTPTAGTAFDLTDKVFKNLKDSVGRANIGSAWPKFCTDYYAGTSTKVAVVVAAVNASGQHASSQPTSNG